MEIFHINENTCYNLIQCKYTVTQMLTVGSKRELWISNLMLYQLTKYTNQLIQLNYTAVPVTGVDSSQPRLWIL